MAWGPTEIGALITAVVTGIGGLWAAFGKPRADSQAALRDKIEKMLEDQRAELGGRIKALEDERNALEQRVEAVERELNDMRYDLRTWQDFGRDIISGRGDITWVKGRAQELLGRPGTGQPPGGSHD